MNRRVDVLSLVVGVLLTSIAVGALWIALMGNINWNVIKIAAPLTLVVVGLLGLTLSRNRE